MPPLKPLEWQKVSETHYQAVTSACRMSISQLLSTGEWLATIVWCNETFHDTQPTLERAKLSAQVNFETTVQQLFQLQ